MWKLLITPFFLLILHSACGQSLRRNQDLWIFNTDTNANITAKIQEEAVLISLLRHKDIHDEITREHVLFGFDIFNFVPQSFRVSVDYPSKKLFINVTSTVDSYSIEYDLKTTDKIESLYLRLDDEDDTVFLFLNCKTSDSIVTPINLITFFRSVSLNKFKILFNKRYDLKVYTEGDNMEVKMQNECKLKDVLPEAKVQFEFKLDKLADSLIKYTPHLLSIFDKSKGDSEITTEVFIKAFLSKDVVHKTSNLYRIVHLIQNSIKSFPEVFEPYLRDLLSEIFWTEGKEHHFVRKLESNYNNDIRVKNYLLNILFANNTQKTFLDSMRNLKDIGRRFRDVFANREVSINKVMKNETNLKYTLLDILLNSPLDEDELSILNPDHIISTMFADYYFKDLNVNPNILNNFQKRVIFNADRNDYVTIGKFIRYIFFQGSGLQQAKALVEPDLVIGMRVVYVLSSGQVNVKQDIYWTIRNLMTKKDVELPKSLEYPEHVIIDTLNKCYLNAESSRHLFMYTLENLLIFNYPGIGQLLDHDQGVFIYNLHRDLILNDIKKEKSILRSVFLGAPNHIHEMISSIIQSVVANVDDVKKLRQVAVDFVNDTLSYAKVEANDTVETEKDYVTVFKKIVGKASSVSDKQKKINFIIVLSKTTENKTMSNAEVIANALSHAKLQVEEEVVRQLIEVYEKYNNNTDILVQKVDEILGEKSTDKNKIEDIIKQDLKEGVTFLRELAPKELRTIFHLSDDEDQSITKERYTKLRELNVLDEWYREEVKYLYDEVKRPNLLDEEQEERTEVEIVSTISEEDVSSTPTPFITSQVFDKA